MEFDDGENRDFFMDELNQNNQQIGFLDRITSKEVLEISMDIIPSLFYIFCISLIIMSTKGYCDISIYFILKTFLYVYSGFIIKGCFHSFLISQEKINSLTSKISLSTCEYIILISYYLSVYMSYYIYNGSPDTCFNDNTLALFVLFCLLLIGLISFFRQALYVILVLGNFPIMVYYFMKNPQNFYSQYGIDPEIVKNLPTVKADAKHCINCVICTEDIKLGDEIIILKCPGRHCFHSNCIRSWLMVKVVCPMCRNENIL